MSAGASAPFHGYLHGSFFPTSSRKAVDAGVELNRLLLKAAANLAAATVRWVAENTASESQRDQIDAVTAARAAVDMLVWSKVASLDGDDEQDRGIDLPEIVARQVSDSFGTFADTAIVPCLDGTQGAKPSIQPIAWWPPRAARSWVDESETFTVGCLADHGRALDIAPILPDLGDERATRLADFLSTHAPHGFVEEPTPSERAAVAESVARSLLRRNASIARWSAFYRDLVGFMEESPSPLAGRQIILCGDGMLRLGRPRRSRERRRKRLAAAPSPSARRKGRSVALLPSGASQSG